MMSASNSPPPLYRFTPEELSHYSTHPRQTPSHDPSHHQYPSVLVIGAGELGLSVLHSLAAHPAFSSISVLLRPLRIAITERYHSAVETSDSVTVSSMQGADSQRAIETRTLENMGIQLVPGDYKHDSVEALAEVFARYHTVVGCSGYEHGGVGLQTKLAHAVLRAGMQRYLPWQFGVDYDILGQGSSQDLFDEQLEVRRLLRAQTGTSWVIASVGVFMSFLIAYQDFGIIDRKARKVRALGSWDTRFTVTDARDIGTLTVAILAEKPEISDQVVFIAGDTLTYGELAEQVERAAPAWKHERELWTNEHLLTELQKDPENGLKKYRPVFASERGIAWEKADSWNGKKGYETRSVRDALELDFQAILRKDQGKEGSEEKTGSWPVYPLVIVDRHILDMERCKRK